MTNNQDQVSVSAVFQFKRALAHMETDFPFSASFGLADSRLNCVASAQEVYKRLLLSDPNFSTLEFETLATIALRRNGELDTEKVKDLHCQS